MGTRSLFGRVSRAMEHGPLVPGYESGSGCNTGELGPLMLIVVCS